MDIVIFIVAAISVIFIHSLILYISFYNKKKKKIKQRIYLPSVQLIYYLVIILSIIFVFVFADKIFTSDLQKFIAYPLISISLVLVFVSRHQLGIYHSPHVEILNDHNLINTGLYKYLDHPIYYFEILAILGTAILANHLFGYFIVFLWTLGIVHKINAENKLLKSEFIEFKTLSERVREYFNRIAVVS